MKNAFYKFDRISRKILIKWKSFKQKLLRDEESLCNKKYKFLFLKIKWTSNDNFQKLYVIKNEY